MHHGRKLTKKKNHTKELEPTSSKAACQHTQLLCNTGRSANWPHNFKHSSAFSYKVKLVLHGPTVSLLHHESIMLSHKTVCKCCFVYKCFRILGTTGMGCPLDYGRGEKAACGGAPQ